MLTTNKTEPRKPDDRMIEILKTITETNKLIVEKLALTPRFFVGVDPADQKIKIENC